MGTGSDLWNQLDALLNSRDFAGAASLFTSDAVWVGPGSRDEGREAIRTVFDNVGKAFSDMRRETSLVVEDGDTVVAEWMFLATCTGPITTPDGTEIATTGKTLKHPGVTVSKIRDGKFATMRTYFDS